jgi:hypothetical protein
VICENAAGNGDEQGSDWHSRVHIENTEEILNFHHLPKFAETILEIHDLIN